MSSLDKIRIPLEGRGPEEIWKELKLFIFKK